MTLKQKFQQEPVVVYMESFVLTNQSAERCEQIADEFAIGFAEWVFKNKGNMELYTITSIDNSYILKSTKELLEIYKKEKGL